MVSKSEPYREKFGGKPFADTFLREQPDNFEGLSWATAVAWEAGVPDFLWAAVCLGALINKVSPGHQIDLLKADPGYNPGWDRYWRRYSAVLTKQLATT